MVFFLLRLPEETAGQAVLGENHFMRMPVDQEAWGATERMEPMVVMAAMEVTLNIILMSRRFAMREPCGWLVGMAAMVELVVEVELVVLAGAEEEPAAEEEAELADQRQLAVLGAGVVKVDWGSSAPTAVAVVWAEQAAAVEAAEMAAAW